MPSFDIVSKVDLQTLDNAINIAKKEIDNRFDFKGTHVLLELNKKDMIVNIEVDSDMKLNQLEDIMLTKAMRQAQVPPALQARLRQMIATEAQQRQTTAPQWRAQVYDPAAPRSRSGPDLSSPPVKRDRQRER